MEPHPSHGMEAQAAESTPFLRGTGPAVDASSHAIETYQRRPSPPRRGGGVREWLALGLGATCVLAAGVVVVTNGSRQGASLARTPSSTSPQSQDTEIAAALSSTLQSMDTNNPALAAMKLGAKGGKEDGEKKATSPHIVFVLVDDQGYNDVGFSSNDVYDFTPRIDALMSEGLLLTSYYAQHLCTPARGALMTGKYPIHLGLQVISCCWSLNFKWRPCVLINQIESNSCAPPGLTSTNPIHPHSSPQHDVIHIDAPWGLPLEHKLLPEYLSEQGYATHMLGKWHLGHFNEQVSSEINTRKLPGTQPAASAATPAYRTTTPQRSAAHSHNHTTTTATTTSPPVPSAQPRLRFVLRLPRRHPRSGEPRLPDLDQRRDHV